MSQQAYALIADIYFHPANNAGANRLNALCDVLATSAPIEVFAVDEGGARAAGERFADPVRVHHLARAPMVRERLVSRLWEETLTAWRLLGMARAKQGADGYRAVIVTVPPLMQLLVAAALRRRRFADTPCFLDVRDTIWEYFDYRPGLAFGVANRLFRTAAGWALRRFDGAVCATPGQAERVRALGQHNVRVIENGIDEWRLSALQALPPRVVDTHVPFVVAYIGTVGFPQGIDTLLAAAAALEAGGHAGILIRIVGNGSQWEAMKALARQRANVEFVDQLDWARCLNEVFARADLLYAQLRSSPAYSTAIPTKLLEYLASGLPVVFGGSGDANRLLGRFDGVTLVPPEDAPALAEALLDAARGPRRRFPGNTERLRRDYRRETLSRQYLDWLESQLPEA